MQQRVSRAMFGIAGLLNLVGGIGTAQSISSDIDLYRSLAILGISAIGFGFFFKPSKD